MKINAPQWFFLVLFSCLSWAFPVQSPAEVNVNIGVFAPPPPLAIAGPPVMAVIPGVTYVYFAPGVSVDIFFYSGYWYRPHEGQWFRARSYRGPWKHIDHGSVSPMLVSLPHSYRNIPPGHQKIPYGQMKKNWRHWENERHWDGREKEHEMRGGYYEGREAGWKNAGHDNKGNGKGKH